MAPLFFHDNVFTSSHPPSDIYGVPGYMSKEKRDKAHLLLKLTQSPPLELPCIGLDV